MTGRLLLITAVLIPTFAEAQTVQATLCSRPDAPLLSSPSDGATLSTSSVPLRGTTAPGLTLQVSDNTAQTATLTSASDGTFGMDFTLALGTHQLDVSVTNGCGSASMSARRTVTRVSASATPTQRPTVRSATPQATPSPAPQPIPAQPISLARSPSPTPQATTTPSLSAPSFSTPTSLPATPFTLTLDQSSHQVSSASLIISGSAAPQSALSFSRNNVRVAFLMAASDGAFSVEVPLEIGLNELAVSSISGAQTQTATLTITRVQSSPPGRSRPTAAYLSGAALLTLSAGGVVWALRRRRIL